MLAVSASEDGIKVLENDEGVQPLHSLENHGVFAFGLSTAGKVKLLHQIY